jgi:hypothetical protein
VQIVSRREDGSYTVRPLGWPEMYRAAQARRADVQEWSSVQQVAARHGVSAKTIRKRIYDGSLKAVDVAASSDPRQRRYRIHRDAEAAWVAAKAETTPAARRRRKTAARRFRDLIA